MNIDIEKLKKKLKSNGYHHAFLQFVNNCEIKPVDCNECKHKNNFGSCQNCAVNKLNLFELEQNELDKLFIGAPVMYDHENNWSELSYWKQSVHEEVIDGVRLPTVEEAPRNIWLAPWVEAQEGLENLNCWCRIKDNDDLYNLQGVLWNEVEAIMILEDFKE